MESKIEEKGEFKRVRKRRRENKNGVAPVGVFFFFKKLSMLTTIYISY